MTTQARNLGRFALAAFLIFAGIGHFVSPESFQAQVPTSMPNPELVIAVSGVIEILLGTALALTPRRFRPILGWVVAGFFIVIFPGNISQFLTATPAFGLDSDLARFVRLLFQPLLVLWALWSTRAWADRKQMWRR